MFAAWFELHGDREVTRRPTALRVYAHLVSNPRIFFSPQETKTLVIGRLLGICREDVARALRLLIERGYLIDHGRARNNVRKLSVALVRDHLSSNSVHVVESAKPVGGMVDS